MPAVDFGCVPTPYSIGNSANTLIARGKPASVPENFLRHSAMAVVAFDPPGQRGRWLCQPLDTPRHNDLCRCRPPAIQRRI